MNDFFVILLIFGISGAVSNFLDIKLRHHFAKKCHYDCNKCQVWDCPYSNECYKHKQEGS